MALIVSVRFIARGYISPSLPSILLPSNWYQRSNSLPSSANSSLRSSDFVPLIFLNFKSRSFIKVSFGGFVESTWTQSVKS
uniref:Secreted protein n=1 Tax=Rodentolepis nana TaxID=102285 RepID=A0A0R3TMY9_RODNA